MGKLGDKVLQKIKEENIAPRPRWQFLLKDYFIWFVFLAALILGAVAFCALLHVLFTNDWDLHQYLHTTFAGHVFISIPYAWLLLLAFFIFVAHYNFKHTKSGYRRETFFVVGLSIVGSLILGTFLHTLGAGGKIEHSVAESLPIYEKISCCGDRKDVWSHPELGLLAGDIKRIAENYEFELEDFRGVIWHVEKDENMLPRGILLIEIGSRVKLIGEKRAERIFKAREIRPWE